MDRYDAVIIGSGLGGLQCAYILARHGMSVCVVEKNAALGGCLQSFRRGSHEYDTGFHYVGGLGEGQILNTLFDYFGLMQLPWHQLDTDGYDEVVLKGKSYMLANGYDAFAESLGRYFPAQRQQIETYSLFLKEVGESILSPVKAAMRGEPGKTMKLFAQNAYGYLAQTLQEPALLEVVSGNSLKLELNRATLPLYTFAQINSSFVQSAWRLYGPGSLIADTLAENIRKMGGCVKNNATAVELVENDGVAQYLEVRRSSGLNRVDNSSEPERIYARYFISDLNPEITLNLLKESKKIRPVFRHRIKNLEQTFGMFTVNIALKPDSIPYLNRNIYWYSPQLQSPWDIADRIAEGTPHGILISSQVPESAYRQLPGTHYARIVDLLTPMSFAEVAKWQDTTVGHRGEEYKEFKMRKARQCIELAEECIPGLGSAIESITTSTPLTYMNYTGTVKGAAYGIRKDCNNLIRTVLTSKTPVSNLFFTGQNLNLHGVLGVSITSLLTCLEILKGGMMVPFLEQNRNL